MNPCKRIKSRVSYPTGTVTRLLMSKSCSHCKQGPAAGSKMLTCGRCDGAFYCNSTYVHTRLLDGSSWLFVLALGSLALRVALWLNLAHVPAGANAYTSRCTRLRANSILNTSSIAPCATGQWIPAPVQLATKPLYASARAAVGCMLGVDHAPLL